MAPLVSEAPAGGPTTEQLLPVCLPRKSGVGAQRPVCGIRHLRTQQSYCYVSAKAFSRQVAQHRQELLD